MTFAGINYWAVLVAGAIGFAFGGVWYRLLAEPWKAAHGFSTEQIRAHHGKGAAPWPLIIALAADLIMAWMLAGVIGHLGGVTMQERRHLRRLPLVRLRFHYPGSQQHLRHAQRQADRHRRRTLAGRLAADGRDHRRLGGLNPHQSGAWRALSRVQVPSHNRPKQKCIIAPGATGWAGRNLRCPTRSMTFRLPGRNAPSPTKRSTRKCTRARSRTRTGSGPSRPSVSTGSNRSARSRTPPSIRTTSRSNGSRTARSTSPTTASTGISPSAATRSRSCGKATIRKKTKRSPTSSCTPRCASSPTCSKRAASRKATASPSTCR